LTRRFPIHFFWGGNQTIGSDIEPPLEITNDFDLAGFDVWDGGMPQVPTPLFISPRGTTGSHPTSIPLVKVEAIADKKLFMYLWGWARYNDIFPDTKRHITRYCWKVSFTRTGTAPTETFQFRSDSCLHNNCSDDECKVQ
jgi:hypothetical protein